MREKDFVPYELAAKLKAIGFNEPCFGYYNSNREFVYGSHTNNEMQRFRYASPLYQQAFRFFREKYELSCSVELTDTSRDYHFDFTICDSKNRSYNDEECFDYCKRIYGHVELDTHEEAELACLIKLIEIVESKIK